MQDTLEQNIPSLMLGILLMSSRTDAENFRALPPGVASGLPNMTPILSRIWLMKMAQVLELPIGATNLWRACDMRRAWSRMMELAPYIFSIWATVRSSWCWRPARSG